MTSGKHKKAREKDSPTSHQVFTLDCLWFAAPLSCETIILKGPFLNRVRKREKKTKAHQVAKKGKLDCKIVLYTKE
jgi:hypothetical protein